MDCSSPNKHPLPLREHSGLGRISDPGEQVQACLEELRNSEAGKAGYGDQTGKSEKTKGRSAFIRF